MTITDDTHNVPYAEPNDRKRGASNHPLEESSIPNMVPRAQGGRVTRTPGRKVPIPPPPRATPSSSSGYPGVSWNKRMGAWLAFYYDADTRRSRTFHPKYYEFDVEKAKQAAIEFMKSIEKHPRCSLRKSRRDAKTAAYLNTKFEIEQQYGDIPGRTRKRASSTSTGVDYKSRNAKAGINCPPTQNPLAEVYDLETLKRNFHMTANLLDQCYMTNNAAVESEYSAPAVVLDNNYLSGSFESQQDYEKGYQSPITWQSCQSFVGNPEYYVDSQGYSVPFLEGDVAYTSPSGGIYHEGELIFTTNVAEAQPQIQTVDRAVAAPADRQQQSVFVTNFDVSPTNEESDIQMLMQSIALSNGESIDGYRLNNYQYANGATTYAGQQQRFTGNVPTPVGSPYFSPYVHTIYNHFPEDSDLNRTFGFQNLILATEPQPNQQTQSVMHSQS